MVVDDGVVVDDSCLYGCDIFLVTHKDRPIQSRYSPEGLDLVAIGANVKGDGYEDVVGITQACFVLLLVLRCAVVVCFALLCCLVLLSAVVDWASFTYDQGFGTQER